MHVFKLLTNLQIFGKLPDTLTISEPWALYHLHKIRRQKQIQKEEYLALLRSCVKLRFKAVKSQEIRRFLQY